MEIDLALFRGVYPLSPWSKFPPL